VLVISTIAAVAYHARAEVRSKAATLKFSLCIPAR
jgi:hypothetical protein